MGRNTQYGLKAVLFSTVASMAVVAAPVMPAWGATPKASPTPVPTLPPATLAECTTKPPTRTSWECVGVGATHKKEDRDPMMEAGRNIAIAGLVGLGITFLRGGR
jgi:hypothetical protein